MNAHALLTSQGWRGSGHSLHPTSDRTGLQRPLLVSRKQNNLGLGKKQHKTSDMWWMNAFDKSLKGLDTSIQGKVVQTVTNSGLDMVAKGGSKFVGSSGLYACFIRGESLNGTITHKDQDVTMPARDPQHNDERNEEHRIRKAAKRAARQADTHLKRGCKETTVEGETDSEEAQKAEETREQRKERRRQKKLMRRKQIEEIAIEATHRKKGRKD